MFPSFITSFNGYGGNDWEVWFGAPWQRKLYSQATPQRKYRHQPVTHRDEVKDKARRKMAAASRKRNWR